MVMVALITQTVVSAGETRLFAGTGLGAVKARMLAMVVAVEEFRFTRPTSASVPVLTDQRSTPHCAYSGMEEEMERAATTTSNSRRRKRSISGLPARLLGTADSREL